MHKRTAKKDLSKTWIYGLHPVKEILLGKRAVHKILVSKTHKFDKEFLDLLGTYKNIVRYVDKLDFNNFLSKDVIHQGIAILIDSPKLLNAEEFFVEAKNNNVNRAVILDRVTDVGNIGAIIRSAAAFGIKYIFIPEYHSFFDYGVLAKASSGMIEKVKIIQVVNIAKLLDLLRENDFWCVGLSASAKQDISSLKKLDKVVLVLGNENKGIRPLVEKKCDLLVSIAMEEGVESLNVSNTAAILFHQFFCNFG